MTPDEIWQAVATERRTLHDQLAPLTEAQWNHESLCESWRIRDVVAHPSPPCCCSPPAVRTGAVRGRLSLSAAGFRC
ncbi:hypothetical protein GPX89_40135 [Nocardia sp. ET3-3]|uniref:Mycothiol-dependent maleylpyruvate isomerase metal-binding domain-containing protein n=1 Tax=Nocardia terrae TaxID=2675851 RepID=A0A7K1V9W3_9NOCA|nr:maleylpyruvate isomerase N-terminal domain-containing protein [Nocardia terrae]MVU83435.1 hypothetical protein [Nocardia terrae]